MEVMIDKQVPVLRFPEFEGEWQEKKVKDVMKRVSMPVKVAGSEFYKQIGIRSHGKGIFHKELVTGESLGDKRVFWVQGGMFILNIVFAWEQAVAKTTKNEIGLIASHRFPMYKSIEHESYLDYIVHFFLTKKGKSLLELASPGGAGRNKTLGQKEFENLKLIFPSYLEQQKIADFLTAIDDKIQQLTQKKILLEQYKKGVMQKIFSQKIRFKDDNENAYPEWQEKSLGEIADVYDGTHTTPDYKKKGIPFYSVEHITGNNFIDTKYISEEVYEKENKRVKLEKGDILMTRIGDIGTSKYISWDVKASFYVSLALIKQSKAVDSKYLDQFIKSNYFQGELHKRTIHVAFPKKINLGEISNCTVKVSSLPEQQKIAIFLTSLDIKIESVEKQVQSTQAFKKGLLQQLFV